MTRESQKIELKKEMEARKKRKDYLDSIEKIIVYDKNPFKVFVKQAIRNDEMVFVAVLENLSNVKYRSIWFMVKANYKEDGKSFQERVRFSSLKAKGLVSAEIFAGRELNNIEFELLKQTRE